MNSVSGIAVRRSIVVDVPQSQAFDVFVDTTSWWPLETHTMGEAPARACVIEPHEGGRWYEVDAKGSVRQIGRVLAYEPPNRLLITWKSTCNIEIDPSVESEIEVHFTQESPGRTRVEFEHRKLEIYGEHAETQRALYERDEAWTLVLARYAARAMAR